jgi:hypothetical protein
MEPATIRPELQPYFVTDQELFTPASKVFKPVCLLDHKYFLDDYPEYYFVVTKGQYSNDPDDERVKLYKKGEVNEYLRGNSKPFTLWISNELRVGRGIKSLYAAMKEKVIERHCNEAKAKNKKR